MRDPVGAVVPGSPIAIFVAHRFQDTVEVVGQHRESDEVHLDEEASGVDFRYQRDGVWSVWAPVPLRLHSRGKANGECNVTGACVSTTKLHDVCGVSVTQDNEYYVATLPDGAFCAGDAVEYYVRVASAGGSPSPRWVRADAEASAMTDSEEAAREHPFRFRVEANATKGLWSEVFPLLNVAAHAHLLPDGRVLMWGRRDRPTQTINTHECTPFIWDPAMRGLSEGTPTPQPTLADGKTKVNLFCAGHTFLPDGRLLTMGGHLFDNEGLQQATIYDFRQNTWTATSLMNDGR